MAKHALNGGKFATPSPIMLPLGDLALMLWAYVRARYVSRKSFIARLHWVWRNGVEMYIIAFR